MNRSRIALFLSLLLLTGCNALGITAGFPGAPTQIFGTPLPTYNLGFVPPVTQVAAFQTSPPVITQRPNATTAPNPTASTNWTVINPTLSVRQMNMNTVRGGVSIIAVRVEPSRASFVVYYVPGQAYSLVEWRAALPQATLLVNGNYFTPQRNAIGLVISNSNSYGGYLTRSDSGLFQVVGGSAKVRSLWLEPYNPSERLEQAIQGYPILAVRGIAAPIDPSYAQTPSRRTVVASDRNGRVLFIITPLLGCTLQEMASWLISSGLEIDAALNLDGGGSTQLIAGPQIYPGTTSLPLMIGVFPR